MLTLKMSKPHCKTEQSHFRPHSIILALILLAGLVGCDQREEQQNESKLANPRQPGTQSAQLDALKDQIQQLQSAFGAQSDILQQIRDNTMPPEWESRLAELEEQVSDVSRWPKNPGEAESFLEGVSALVTGLPLWAEPQYLPRLSRIRWAAMVFTTLNDAPDADSPLATSTTPTTCRYGWKHLNAPPDEDLSPDQLDQRVDQLRALATATPEGTAEELVSLIQECANALSGEAVRRRVSEAVQEAEQLLEGPQDATANMAEVVALELDAVEQEAVDPDVDIPALRQKLYKEVLRRQAVEQVDGLRSDWQTVRQFKPDLPSIYEAHQPQWRQYLLRRAERAQQAVRVTALRTLLQQVASSRMALVLDGVHAPAHERLERELRHAVAIHETEATRQAEERHARAVRSYQRWALAEIRKFNDQFQEISEKAVQASSWLDTARVIVRRSPEARGRMAYKDIVQYREVRQAMIDHLLPINRALLDLPVHKLYEQAFEKGWTKLAGRREQTEVAEATASAKKEPLRAFLEDGS